MGGARSILNLNGVVKLVVRPQMFTFLRTSRKLWMCSNCVLHTRCDRNAIYYLTIWNTYRRFIFFLYRE